MRTISPAYQTYVFDCDGVILDSNRIKTDAFRTAGLPFGDPAADLLVAYHRQNGGISRFYKFRHFLDTMVEGREVRTYEQLLDDYAGAVRSGLAACAVEPGLAEFRELTADSRWLVVSGAMQDELREVLAERGIDHWFDGGIFGSPDDKDTILARELECGNIECPALFIGDSKYDWRAATGAGLDFVFATYWTEVEDWPAFTQDNGIEVIHSLQQLHSRSPA